MKKTLRIHKMLTVITGLLLLGSLPAHAQQTDITVDLQFGKTYYAVGEPIGVTVTVKNQSGHDLLVPAGFQAGDYYLYLLITDPSGKLLLAQSPAPAVESPDAPPYGSVLYNGAVIKVAGCEVLPVNWQKTSQTSDIRLYYSLPLPGYYAAQVQIPVKVFKGAPGDPCKVDDYDYAGPLLSPTRFFYVEGSTEVQIIPTRWPMAWKDGRYVFENLQVVLWPQAGGSVDDYDWNSIKLNNVPAAKVYKMYSAPKKKHYLAAFFSKQQSILSLGNIQAGWTYPVRISGQFKNGGFFGGANQIKVVSIPP